MSGRYWAAIIITSGFFTLGMTQELSISTAAKTYASGEQVWANLSVLGAAALPGAFKIKVDYDATKLRFLNILPARQGPFSVTAAASNSGSAVTIAGFQGIADTGRGTVSLATLVFIPASGSATIDTASFSINSKEVYTTQAQAMDLKVTKQTTSVLLPSPRGRLRQRIVLTNNYLRFTVMNGGVTSVRIVDLNGKVCATPLPPSLCKAGYQAVPVGRPLKSGVYIVALRGAGFGVNEKLEVVR